MTERKAIQQEIAQLETEIRAHYTRSDQERLAAEAKEAGVRRLQAVLTKTARKPKEKEGN